MKFKLFMFLVVASFFAQAMEADSLRAEKRGDQWYIIHRVEQGETLYSLSRRYKSDLNAVVKHNQIVDNQISIGQVLEFPVEIKTPSTPTSVTSKGSGKLHTVAAGETLFSLSRKYNITVAQIQKWNKLSSDQLSIGQELVVSRPGTSKEAKESIVKEKEPEQPKVKQIPPPFPDAKGYTVKAGDNLTIISRTLKIDKSELKKWNKLTTDNIQPGQILWYKLVVRETKEVKGDKVFGKSREEGIAMQIENLEGTTKYLCLHRSLPNNTLIEVTNSMNNRKVFVRVIGKLPATGENEGVLIRLTPVSFKRLGIIDDRARVVLSYYDNEKQ